MKRLTICSLLFLITINSGLAKDKYAPLPAKIIASKTVFILNLTGAPEAADNAYKELTSWGRFALTEERDKADLVFVLTATSSDSGVVAMPLGNMVAAIPIQRGVTTLHIFDAKLPDSLTLWTISRSWGSGGTKACIKELRKRIQHQEKAKKSK